MNGTTDRLHPGADLDSGARGDAYARPTLAHRPPTTASRRTAGTRSGHLQGLARREQRPRLRRRGTRFCASALDRWLKDHPVGDDTRLGR